MNRLPPTPSPQRGSGLVGQERQGGWVTAEERLLTVCSLSPFPSQFHFHIYSHPPGTGGGWCSLNAGNWLSLWSSVYFPPLLPLPRPRPEQLGNLQQNTAVMRLPWTRAAAWVCPALPCPVSTWGTFLSWKGSWGSPSRNVAEVSLPLPLPSWHQVSSCGGPAGLPFGPGLWATAMSGHLSRDR